MSEGGVSFEGFEYGLGKVLKLTSNVGSIPRGNCAAAYS